MTWEIGAYSVGNTLPTLSTPPVATTGWAIGAYNPPVEPTYHYYANMPTGSDSYYVNFPAVSTYYYYANLIADTGWPTPVSPPVAATGWVIGAYKV